ncbi:MAG: adenylate/guanylate cyclase domain-containing protein [Synergistaceae bacterium]|nr:adenylate/guanylate cyclase domain-containing protein [Synergistaceae bacterium]
MRTASIATLAALWLLFAAFYALNAFEGAENRLYDRMHQRVRPVDSRVVIIAVDDASIARLGQWPWPRDVMGGVVDVLTEGGAAVVGIDVLFDTPSRVPGEDERLAGSLVRAGNVVLSAYGLFRARTADGPMRADELVAPVDALRGGEPPIRLAHVNGLTEGDGVMRRALLELYYGETRYRSLAAEMYKLYKGAEPNIPTDGAGRYYISFTGRAGWYHPLSFADVHQGRVPPGYFKDRLVLIGPYAQGLARDWQFTAIDGDRPTYGVEIHANMLQQLLEGNFLTDLPRWIGFAVFSIFTLSAAALFLRRKPRLGLVLLLVLLLAYGGATYLIARGGYVTRVIYAPAFCVLAYFASLAWHYAQTRADEARVRSTFGKYMAPNVLRKILDEGEDGLKLGGQRRTVTVLFVDIRGFTPLSESVPPEEIVQILNEYLNLVASCIHRHGGTLDKFIGDAAMAFWGAPYDVPDHTLAAVRAALAMREESAALERKLTLKYGRGVRFGIGVNTGDAIIGNIGASFRMDYTAIGDTVNTAARLESNAAPGQILISRAAADNLPDKSVELNFLGGLKVKGKAEEVPVYEVIGA